MDSGFDGQADYVTDRTKRARACAVRREFGTSRMCGRFSSNPLKHFRIVRIGHAGQVERCIGGTDQRQGHEVSEYFLGERASGGRPLPPIGTPMDDNPERMLGAVE